MRVALLRLTLLLKQEVLNLAWQVSNLAFADGHVAWFPGPQVVQTDVTNPFVGGMILPPIDIVWA